MLALAQVDAGETSDATRTLESLTVDDLRRGEHENAWGSVLALLAEVATTAESAPHAALLDELLEPFTGRLIATVIGLACLGAAERYRGMLCTTLERWDDADGHFERALELERRIRGRALLPRTRFWQARFLLRRARPNDESAARTILDDVIAETSALGMGRLRERAQRLRPT
jgi:hypothetical protein